MNDFSKFSKGKVNTLGLHDYMNHQNKMYSSMTPYILEERTGNLAVMDVFSRLMVDRIIFLGTAIDDITANIVNAQLLYLQYLDKNNDIKIYINTPGGDAYSGSAILDCMDIVNPDVGTVCLGLAASMGASILGHGTKGKRKATKRSRIMMHQPWGGASGNTQEIILIAEEYKSMKDSLIETFAQDTGRTIEEINIDITFDKWMSSQKAKEYGLIDEIITKK